MYNSNGDLIGILGVSRDITDFYNSQERLREKEEMYSTIVNQANDSIALIDPDTGKFVEFNKTAHLSLGYTREEFEKINVMNIEKKLTRDEIINMFRNTEDVSRVFESQHICKDGTIKDVRLSNSAIMLKGKKYYSTMWSDITKIKEISNKIEEQKNFLELLINAIPNQIFWKDKELFYQGCNKIFANITGIESTDSVIGLTDYDFPRNPIYANSYRDFDLKVIETGKEILNIEEKYFDSNGNKGVILTSKVPIKNQNKNVVGVLGICVDITDRKNIELALSQSEEKYRTLIESATDSIFIIKNGKIEYVNNVLFFYHLGLIPRSFASLLKTMFCKAFLKAS